MRLSVRLYRRLLKLYPARFRENYTVPMQRQFEEDYRDVRGTVGLVRLWGRTLLDVARSAPVLFAQELAYDTRHTLRLWRGRPLPTVFAIAVLAVAIGANAGVFSVLNALLLRSLPFTEPDRLAVLHMFGPPRAGFHEWRQQSRYLADAIMYDTLDVNVEGVDQSKRLRLTETSWNFFSMLGRHPSPGRSFADGEDMPGRNEVAVIGHGLWQQLFGGDPRALGSTIRVNGTALTVVGVAQPGFDYPQRTDLWTPTTFDYERIPKTGSVLFWVTIGRLQPGLTWAQARHAFETEAYERAPDRRDAEPVNRPALIPLRDQLAGPVRSASLILLGGVALLLLLACANVANLLLARTVARSHELMIRTALGASRARLTQQLLTESLMLSMVAGALGLFVARWSASLAAAVQPAQLAAQSYTMDWRVLGFATALSVVTGLFFGVFPALHASRGPVTALHRSATAGLRQTRTANVLVAAQITITIVLLTGSAALGRAFIQLLQADLGYDTSAVVTMNVSLAGTGRETDGNASAYYEAVLDRVRNLPGVVSASATTGLPLAIDSFMGAGFNVDHTGPAPLTTVVSVAPGFFRTMGTQMLAGREFSPDDLAHGEPLAVVNDEFARLFGGPSAVIGRHATAERWPAFRIIGVARTIRVTRPTDTPHPQLFRLARGPAAMALVARVTGDAPGQRAMIRDAVQALDPKVPVFDVKTMEERLDAALARPKFYTTAVVFFGGIGLLLAIVGVYGVVSYTVAQRTREMGIRLALGTTPGRLRGTLLRQAILPVGAGSLAGVALALAFTRYLQTLVAGADAAPLGAATFGVIVTAAVAATAIWSATRHIARLDIADVLRAETAD